MRLFTNNIKKVTKIKICGITRIEDINNCYKLGIDALGFLLDDPKNKFPTDKLLPDEAKYLIREVPAPVVSVLLIKRYTNFNDISQIIDEIKPKAIQLQEPDIKIKTIKSLREKYSNIEIIRTIQIIKGKNTFLDIMMTIDSLINHVDAILLDSKKGGSGEIHDWNLSSKVSENLKHKNIALVLAGGLDSQNVGEAIGKVKPDMVDIMTGATVENQKGIKDISKIQGIINAVKIQNKLHHEI